MGVGYDTVDNGLTTITLNEEDDTRLETTTDLNGVFTGSVMKDSDGNTIQTVTVNEDGNLVTTDTPIIVPSLPDPSAATRLSSVNLSNHNITTYVNPFEFKPIVEGQVNQRNTVTRAEYYLSEADGNPYYNGKLAETFIGFWPCVVDKFYKYNFVVNEPVVIAFSMTKRNFTLPDAWAQDRAAADRAMEISV